MSARRRARAAMEQGVSPKARRIDSGVRARLRRMSVEDWTYLLKASHPAADFDDSLARAHDLRM